MHPLKQLLLTPPLNDEWKALRVRAVECITCIAAAVGREMFRPDAHDVVVAMQEILGDLDENSVNQVSVFFVFSILL